MDTVLVRFLDSWGNFKGIFCNVDFHHFFYRKHILKIMIEHDRKFSESEFTFVADPGSRSNPGFVTFVADPVVDPADHLH